MRLPLKVHAVKIKYRERLLRNIPHGKFSTYRGKRSILVTYIPGNPDVSVRSPKRYVLTGKLGKLYTPQIEQYLNIKAEYDRLLAEWRATYSFEPPEVKFPIVQTYDPHGMNNEYYEQAVANQSDMPNKHPVYSGDDVFKSKNEQFGKDVLCSLGIPYKYETLLGDENAKNPDFLLSFFEIDRCIYAEICGMTDDYEYSTKLARKINFYSTHNYRHEREVIYCFMHDKYNFDEECFAAMVLSAFDMLIPDSALDWNNCRPPRITSSSAPRSQHSASRRTRQEH